MKAYTRIIVPLSKEELDSLRQLAKQELRDPRDQVRHILRLALWGNNDQMTNENTNAVAAKHTAPVL
jgi:hypothetical protein